MTGSTKYIVERAGRYWARLVIPKELRPVVGKTELREALGSDRRLAERRAHAVIARFLDTLLDARRKLDQGNVVSIRKERLRTRPLSAEEMARSLYAEELAHDDWTRDAVIDGMAQSQTPSMAELFRPGHAKVLKEVAAGHASNEKMAAAVGWAVDRFRARGQTKVANGTEEWRRLCRILASVQLEVLKASDARDASGDTPEPSLAVLQGKAEVVDLRPRPTLGGLFDGYFKEVKATGKGRQAERRWRPVFRDLESFLQHNDARQVTRQDLVRWKDNLVTRLKPKTIKDVHLAAVRAIFSWAVDNELLDANPASAIKVKAGRRSRPRELGFNRSEALAVLKAAQDYQPPVSVNPRTRQSPKITAAKRWAPWLAAYTGARISELTQLRKEDVHQEGGIHYIRITPAAGSVKADHYRDVPLHPHLVEMGFLDFVKDSGPGPLFFEGTTSRKEGANPAEMVSARISKWIRSLDLIGDVAPNHGWRHRFKTIGTEEGMDLRVLDAIQGHAPRTAGDNYGDVTLKAKWSAIEKHPRYNIDR